MNPLFKYVFRDFAGPYEIYRHRIGPGQYIVQSYRGNGSADIEWKPVDAVGMNAQTMEKEHRVTFAASDIQHRTDAVTLDEESPQDGRPRVDIAMAHISTKVRPALIDHMNQRALHLPPMSE